MAVFIRAADAKQIQRPVCFGNCVCKRFRRECQLGLSGVRYGESFGSLSVRPYGLPELSRAYADFWQIGYLNRQAAFRSEAVVVSYRKRCYVLAIHFVGMERRKRPCYGTAAIPEIPFNSDYLSVDVFRDR